MENLLIRSFTSIAVIVSKVRERHLGNLRLVSVVGSTRDEAVADRGLFKITIDPLCTQ